MDYLLDNLTNNLNNNKKYLFPKKKWSKYARFL